MTTKQYKIDEVLAILAVSLVAFALILFLATEPAITQPAPQPAPQSPTPEPTPEGGAA